MENTASSLLKLSVTALLSAKALRNQILLVEGLLSREGDRFTVMIARDAHVATSGAGRKELSRPTNPLWRFAGGGALVILRLTDVNVALLRLRDSGAPSFGGHYTLGSGLSGSVRDLLFPEELALREAMEEFIIASPEGIVAPCFGDRALDAIVFGAVASGLELIQKQSGLPELFQTERLITARASFFHPSTSEQELIVHVEDGEEATARGYVVVDPGTRGIDLLRFVTIDLPYRLDEIAIFDGEDMDHKPLDGEVACLELNQQFKPQGIVRAYRTGRSVPASGVLGRMTPVLKAAVDLL